MCSIPKALASIKSAVTEAIPARVIERACRQVGHRYRKRDLNPVVTTQLFLQQVLNGNTSIAELRLRGKAGRDNVPAYWSFSVSIRLLRRSPSERSGVELRSTSTKSRRGATVE